MPSKLQRAIGAVKDQTSISLAKVSNTTSSSLEVAVLKATTHDDDPVDEKYVHEVLLLVSSNKYHAAACARAIGKRIGRTRNWMVALKSLMLVLRIFQDGDPYFPREVFHAMKRGARILNLSSFRDESSSSSPWDFTSFVRTFALYLDERLECFLTGKLQRRRHGIKESPTYVRGTPRGGRRPNEPTLDMKPAMLLDRITYWQRLLDRAIATRPTGEARINRLVQTCLYAIVQESFDLYKDISDGLSLILDSFFHLQFQNCVNAYHACAKAAKQFKELNNFYTLCKSIGVGRSSEYPSVQTISEDLIEALQEFLNDQSTSFSSNAKATLSETPKRGERETPQRSLSEAGLQGASLQDLINATATKTSAACPAISIDLEAYDEPQRDEAFMVSDTTSVMSLPVTYSMVDLISLWDGSELDEREQQQQQQHQQLQQQHSLTHSSPSDNWELVLAETLSLPSPSLSAPSPLPTSDYKPTLAGNSSENWELILFEPSPPPQPQPDFATPPNNYYNPFLVDPTEVPSLQHTVSLPTFRATPQISTQFHHQPSFLGQNHEMDPFCIPSISRSSSMDQQKLMHEQLQWLANQNKIIAKYM